ncbi:hypothetical protein PM082_002383 [Marasmius tenuissimus]|nr:hypothetical protein PM082_002383 [Marasmius tenuissimus]
MQRVRAGQQDQTQNKQGSSPRNSTPNPQRNQTEASIHQAHATSQYPSSGSTLIGSSFDFGLPQFLSQDDQNVTLDPPTISQAVPTPTQPYTTLLQVLNAELIARSTGTATLASGIGTLPVDHDDCISQTHLDTPSASDMPGQQEQVTSTPVLGSSQDGTEEDNVGTQHVGHFSPTPSPRPLSPSPGTVPKRSCITRTCENSECLRASHTKPHYGFMLAKRGDKEYSVVRPGLLFGRMEEGKVTQHFTECLDRILIMCERVYDETGC